MRQVIQGTPARYFFASRRRQLIYIALDDTIFKTYMLLQSTASGPQPGCLMPQPAAILVKARRLQRAFDDARLIFDLLAFISPLMLMTLGR